MRFQPPPTGFLPPFSSYVFFWITVLSGSQLHLCSRLMASSQLRGYRTDGEPYPTALSSLHKQRPVMFMASPFPEADVPRSGNVNTIEQIFEVVIVHPQTLNAEAAVKCEPSFNEKPNSPLTHVRSTRSSLIQEQPIGYPPREH
ncbi:hypothetical protein HPB50_009865 [Hyalomma asiaticum]|uniref:Uncharacterized protein n=1 Tax=Hyalomma asiaticum TaxID=266040 RepID=A0ACB7SJH5_HYAAI|nr:hypothetical protein HPB50_009865 [Hyalomma asiaticum]